jgi:hypothetical protein
MRGVLIGLSSILVACLAGVTACQFDDATFGEHAAGDGDDAASDNEDPGEILIDGSPPDALIVRDGGPPIDGSGCDPSDCDCDKDGYKNTLKAGCGSGARDCDDTDPRTHPLQGFREESAVLPQVGDWNCDMVAEPLYATSVTCDKHLLGIGCSNVFGFEDAPRCGQAGHFIRCKKSLLNLGCAVGTRMTITQPCR